MDLLKSIAHPEEVYALLKFKIGKSPINDQHANTVRVNSQNITVHFGYFP